MKNIRNLTWLFLSFSLILVPQLRGQDSLNTDLIKPFARFFEIKDGRLDGAGASFIEEASENSQYTLIGEYHGSKKISEFTEALIPQLDEHNYRYFALEVGPISAKKLTQWSQSTNDVQQALFDFNHRYNYMDGDFTAIPFFSYKEDAAFLQQSALRNWALIGLDQEFYFGFEMLLDVLFEQLNSKEQQQYQSAYQTAKDSLNAITRDDIAEKRRLPTEVNHCSAIQDFLDQMNLISGNEATVDAFRTSIALYKMNNDRQWRANNEQRALYMKQNMRQSMEQLGFDLKQDKMLIKMGGYHNSRGQSPMEVFDVGNMMSELAEFHGNSSLHITFTPRFYMEEGRVKDQLQEEPDGRYNIFAALGKKDQWVVIDLREIQHGLYYYPIKYRVTKEVEDLIKRYDLLIIPPIEADPTPNY